MSTADLVILSTLIILAAIAGLAYLLYYKISLAIDRQTKHGTKLANNTISQIESLMALYAETKPNHGLARSRGWAASPDFLHILIDFFTERGPKTVVECSSGLSTVILAACMRNQGSGRVLSLEHDPKYAEKTRALIRLHQLEDWAQVVDAPLKQITIDTWSGRWYDVSGLPDDIKIDMLVIDGPPWDTTALARYPAVPIFSECLSDNAVVVMDDADRVDETEIAKRWETAYDSLTRVAHLYAEKGVVAFSRKSPRSNVDLLPHA